MSCIAGQAARCNGATGLHGYDSDVGLAFALQQHRPANQGRRLPPQPLRRDSQDSDRGIPPSYFTLYHGKEFGIFIFCCLP